MAYIYVLSLIYFKILGESLKLNCIGPLYMYGDGGPAVGVTSTNL